MCIRDSSIVVGYTAVKDWNPELNPGETINSIGFYSDTGLLFAEKAEDPLPLIDNKVQTGDIIGIGYSKQQEDEIIKLNIWCTLNGKFLNKPPDEEEAIEKQFEEIQQSDLKDLEKDNLREKIEIDNERRMKAQLYIEVTGQEVRPVIATAGPVRLNVNIGAAPFVSQIPEFRRGMLLSLIHL
eukprot:TRINITY_DN6494_c0_g1_i3.p1 TRINITY_DN6494_c0_g1~~TRINITY_DN6494_c0_g1_i3.p1  ORF type:complete len:190 (+),score=35.44 TRINITY_DN6494_c0_g1_i3:24-572(+)